MDSHRLDSLREALPFIRAYRGRTFVVKLSGRLGSPGDALAGVVDQVAVLHALGIRIVVVHGGGDQLTELSTRMGLEPRIVNGRRVTDAATLELAKMAFAGSVNTNVLAAFRRQGTPAVGVSGVDAGLVRARRRPPQVIRDVETGREGSVDFGFVGDVERVDPAVLTSLMDAGFVPVVAALAADDAGQVLNVNADTVAARIAVALSAVKFFSLTNVDGVMGSIVDPRSLKSLLSVSELRGMLESGAIRGGMLPKLAACIDAIEGGVGRVHIIHGGKPGTLLTEVFTNQGCGTLIHADRERGTEPPGGAA